MKRFRHGLIGMVCCCLLFAMIYSCGSSSDGGGGGTGKAAPKLSVRPATYDFGIVTESNMAEPLAVAIRNDGTADLRVSSIAISQQDNFALNLDAGTNPCGAAPTLGPSASCIVTVDFLPTVNASYLADLTIRSNDAATPTYVLKLRGRKEPVSQLNITINQIEPACPPPAESTVYVTVLDQAGFPVSGLARQNFEITEAGQLIGQPTSAANLELAQTISVSLVMDYSGSITDEPDNVEKMENAAINFVTNLGAEDEAEIIKYEAQVQVTQPFTGDKALLINAIQTTTDLGVGTALYDAIFKAAENLSGRQKDRKAIIAITDGVDTDGTGKPISKNTIESAISKAKEGGIPVFTVGLGASTDAGILQHIALQTGGTFYSSTTPANLATIYQQLADLLFSDQYVLKYNSIAGGSLVVKASHAGLSGFSDTTIIPSCP